MRGRSRRGGEIFQPKIIERLDLSDERLGDQMAEGKFGVERKGTGGYHFSPKKDAWWFAEEKSHRKET